MHCFVKNFVVPQAKTRGWSTVCEIGASCGASTDLLTSLPNVAVTVIDPCLDCDLKQKYAGNDRVTVRKGISLEILSCLEGPFDCILIDGDHNWYTVYNELRLIFERRLLQKGGFIFFHDVDWPYGRRDLYYQPDLIPAEYRHHYEQKGIVRNQSELAEHGGFNPEYRNAVHEGGPKNGVLTAIEDFLREHAPQYQFFRLRGQYGLGVMCQRNALKDDLAFLRLRGTFAAYQIVASSKQFAWNHFPAMFNLAKSFRHRGKSYVQPVG